MAVKFFDLKTKEEQNAFIERIIFYCLVFGILLSLLLAFLPKQTTNYSLLYLKPNSYSNYLENNVVYFSFGIKNNESADTNYAVKYFLGEVQYREKNFFVKKGEIFEKDDAFSVSGEQIKFPLQLKIAMSSGETNYQVYFWIKERK